MLVDSNLDSEKKHTTTNFQDLFIKYLESENPIDEAKEEMFHQFPGLQEIIKAIQAEKNTSIKVNLVMALYVLAGIKPVLQLYDTDNKDAKTISDLFKSFSNLKFVQRGTNYYLINESPLAEFDPRKFILNFNQHYSSIEEAVTYAFPNQGKVEEDKLLIY